MIDNDIAEDEKIMPSDDMPRGLDEDYLIDPEYALAKSWGIYALDDRLDFEQISMLVLNDSLHTESLCGAFPTKYGNKIVGLTRCVPSIGQFMFELSGDHVALFDVPSTFIISVLYGDISLVAADRSILKSMFGADEMSQDDWQRILDFIIPELADKLRSRYFPTFRL